ncbi:hypothetical protein C8R47DRAFT_753045 [Mycena vitilis]|nr:hypothetical protein C8R47DRAFT_753045 [Mycena vitilis]
MPAPTTPFLHHPSTAAPSYPLGPSTSQPSFPTLAHADTTRTSSLYIDNDYNPNPSYHNNFPQNNMTQNSPNPFQPDMRQQQYNWDLTVAQNALYTMQGSGCDGSFSGQDLADTDEDFGPHWSERSLLGAPINRAAINGTAIPPASGPASPASTPGSAAATSTAPPVAVLETTPNLRVFPQADQSISATPVALIPRKRCVGSVADAPVAVDSSPTVSALRRRPLVRRADIFGSGLHDTRQRPLTPSSSTPVVSGGKENATEELMSDDESAAPARKRPCKESRKVPGARGIGRIRDEDPIRSQALEYGYNHIRLRVLTDETKTWARGASSDGRARSRRPGLWI